MHEQEQETQPYANSSYFDQHCIVIYLTQNSRVTPTPVIKCYHHQHAFQVIIRSNGDILWIGPLVADVSEIRTRIQKFLSNTCIWEVTYGKCQSYSLGLDVLINNITTTTRFVLVSDVGCANAYNENAVHLSVLSTWLPIAPVPEMGLWR